MSIIRDKTDLPRRAATGVLLIAGAALALWLGGIAFWLLCAVGALFMMAEWADLEKVPGRQKRIAQFALSVPLATMACRWSPGARRRGRSATVGNRSSNPQKMSVLCPCSSERDSVWARPPPQRPPTRIGRSS